MAGKQFCLTKDDFRSSVSDTFKSLRENQELCDVTLVADDQIFISAHKVIISAFSNFFRELFKKVNHPNPLLYLNGIDSKYLNYILDYVYNGEVKLIEDDIEIFLKCARKLKIIGIFDTDIPKNEELDNNESQDDEPQESIEGSDTTEVDYNIKVESIMEQEIEVADTGLENEDFIKSKNSTVDETKSRKSSKGNTSELLEDSQMHASPESGKLYCRVCEKHIVANHHRHIRSIGHISNMKFMTKDSTEDLKISEAEDSNYCCHPCQFFTNKMTKFEEHMNVKVHKTRLKKPLFLGKKSNLKCRICSFETYKDDKLRIHLRSMKHTKNDVMILKTHQTTVKRRLTF